MHHNRPERWAVMSRHLYWLIACLAGAAAGLLPACARGSEERPPASSKQVEPPEIAVSSGTQIKTDAEQTPPVRALSAKPGSEIEALPVPEDAAFEPAIQEQLAEAQALVRINGQDAEAVGRLAMLYHLYGFRDEAATLYRRAAQIDPAEARWEHLLGRLLLDGRQSAEAVPHLRKAVALDGDALASQVLLGEAYLASGQAGDGVESLRPVREAYPDSDVVAYTAGRLYLAAGQPALGFECFKPILDGFPQMGGVRQQLAACAAELGQDGEAQRILEAGPRNDLVPVLADPEMLALRALATGLQAERMRGLAALTRGDLAAAKTHFDNALAFAPTDKKAMLGQAQVLERVGQTEEAGEMLRAMLMRNQNDVDVVLAVARLKLNGGYLGDAEALLNRANLLAPDRVGVLSARARLAVAREDKAEAVRLLEALRDKLPASVSVQLDLASAYVDAGRDADAERTYLLILEQLDPGNGVAMHGLGEIYRNRGNLAVAVGWYERARSHGVVSATGYLNLAVRLNEDRRYDESFQVVLEAVQAYPLDGDLLDLLSRMYSMCPESRLRDGAKAYAIARRIYGKDDSAISYQGLQTLGAAHAEAGNWEEAIRCMELAVQRGKEFEDPYMIDRASQALKRYQRGVRLYE